MAKNGTPLEWALEKVSPEPMSGCWLWMGSYDKDGYGKLSFSKKQGKRSARAHRWIYEQLRGPIPDDLVTDHKCRVRCCVNPDHIEIVTTQENSRRGVPNIEACRKAGKLSGCGERSKSKTHCPSGHEYAGYNLIIYKSGSRACRECTNRRNREQKQKTKELTHAE